MFKMILSSFAIVILFLLAENLADTPQPRFGVHGRLTLSLRDETWIDTPGTTQDLCGDSTFEAVNHDGPSRYDCEYLMNTAKRNPDGFWMAGNFGPDGMAWVEFTRLRTCGIKVRRTDGQKSDVPFGDADVVDLVNSVLTDFPAGRYLPTVQGQMTCNKLSARAVVEWQIFKVSA